MHKEYYKVHSGGYNAICFFGFKFSNYNLIHKIVLVC